MYRMNPSHVWLEARLAENANVHHQGAMTALPDALSQKGVFGALSVHRSEEGNCSHKTEERITAETLRRREVRR